MNRQTLQALSTLTRDRLSCIDLNILDAKLSITYWLPRCNPELKTDPDVREAYSMLNSHKNRLRMLRAQRSKWATLHAQVLAPLKVAKSVKPKPHPRIS